MSRFRRDDDYNEHGQDDRVSLEEKAYDRDMTPGLDEHHAPLGSAPGEVAWRGPEKYGLGPSEDA